MIKDSEKFDIENYVTELSNQADKLMPEDINLQDKKYVVSTLYNFMKVAYEGLEKEDEILNIEKASYIVQLIGEWTFHKGIDLKRAKIEREYSDVILQKIAYVVYDIAKQAVMENFTEEQTLQVIVHHVKKTYDEELKILYENDLSNKEYQDARTQSNIDIMSEQKDETEKYQEKPCLNKMIIFKFVFLAIVFLSITIFADIYSWQRLLFCTAGIILILCCFPQLHMKINIIKSAHLKDFLIYFLLCDKKVKMAKYRVRLVYFKLLRELTSQYSEKSDRIEFINKYKKQNKIINKVIIKIFLRNGILPIALLYAIYSSTNFYNNIIFAILCILIIIPCTCEMIVYYRFNQLDIIRSAMLKLIDNKK